MKYTILLVISLFFVSLSFAIVEETASFSQFIYGTAPECEYDNWISHISKGIAVAGYNQYAPFYRHHPNHPFGDFHIPSATELDNWLQVCEFFIYGDLETAAVLIELYGFPYRIVRFHDTDTGRTYDMLREILNMSHFDDQGTPETTDDVHGGFDYGWGLFVVWRDAPQPIIVSLVHPGDDFNVSPLAVMAFQEWDAKYLMIAGAGREVKWTNVSPYLNSKSLSDPSRVTNHPFNSFYTTAADDIRSSFGRREYSAQLHSFDWSSHAGAANIQISAGPEQDYPSLPIRDFSSRKRDILHNSPYLIHEANTIGMHHAVYNTEYFTVFYNPALQPFIYDDGENVHPVTNYVTLPGVAGNVQFVHTNTGRNKFDVLSTFLHIEFAELPICYPRTLNYYRWFYGYDLSTGTYDMSRRFDNTKKYYRPFIVNMRDVLHEALAMENYAPTPTPTNFLVQSTEFSRATFTWDAIDSYDFESYELHFSTTLQASNPTIYDRASDTRLSSAMTTTATIPGLTFGVEYFIKLRAKNYNGTFSEFTPEISFTPSLANITNLATFSLEDVVLSWSGQNQHSTLQGYRIYRGVGDETPVVIADWTTHPSLARTSPNQSFSFTDTDVQNFENYFYEIAMVFSEGENRFHRVVRGSPRPLHHLIMSDIGNNVSSEVYIGYSPFSSDGPETSSGYDIVIPNATQPAFLISSFQPGWVLGSVQGVRLSREIKADIDPLHQIKSYNIRLRSDRTNLRIRYANRSRHSEKVVLFDPHAQVYVNLMDEDYVFTVPNANNRDFQLFVGNVQPILTITNASTISNRIYAAGDNLVINFSTQYAILLDHYRVSLETGDDSIMINSSVQPTSNSVSFTIPNGITMHDARVVFEAHCTDGEIRRFVSAWAIGILPASTTITYSSGGSFIANPLTTTAIPLSMMAGNTTLYAYQNNDWISDTQASFGMAYLLNTVEDFSIDHAGAIQKINVTRGMTPGWNFVANPHLIDYDIKDLNFNLNNTSYQYGELLQNNIVTPTVRVVRNGVAVDTDRIYALESFMIYANINPTDNLSIRFIPYQKNPCIIANRFEWSASIRVGYQDSHNSAYNSDEIVVNVGEFHAANHLSLIHHQPKPIKLPGGMAFYLRPDFEGFGKYHSSTVRKLATHISDFVAIPFTIELPAVELITFDYSSITSQLDYHVVILINGHEYSLDSVNTTFSFMPTDAVVTGEIRVCNQKYVDTIDEVVMPLSLSVYPNPFNPQTNIALSIPRTANVSVRVFNIKGQVVKNVISETMRSGNHIVSWNGRDNSGKSVATGIYFISVNIEGEAPIVKKVTMLK